MVTIVAPPRPTVYALAAVETRPDGTAARTLARLYLRYVSAHWRGDEVAPAFARQLDAYWVSNMPPAPSSIPDALSPHGGAGHGICWYSAPTEIRGYVTSASGGYRVPIAALDGLARTLDPAADRERPEPAGTPGAGARAEQGVATWTA